MLSLDDPRWATLSSPGGPLGVLIAYLQELRDDPAKASNAISEIFEYACHQGSVYGTTVAIAPYLVQAAGELPPAHQNRCELLANAGLLTLLVGDRLERLCPKSLASQLGKAFTAATVSAASLATTSLLEKWPEDEFARLVAALAAFQGHAHVGWLLSRSSRPLRCPGCDAELQPLQEWGRAPR